MKIRKVTRANADQAVAEKVPFKYNRSANGAWVNGRLGGLGSLNYDEEVELNAHMRGIIESYVVFSYETPIAIWNRQNGWWTTDRYFSRTTSTHQGFVRRGADLVSV